MANTAFPNGITGALTGLIDFDTAVFKAALVRGYTYSASHTFVSDVTGAGGTLNGTSAALGSVTVTAGVLDAADTSVSATANATDHGVLIFQASAVTGGADVAASAQRLVAYLDTGTNLPIQPGTTTVSIAWDNGTNKIIKFG
jgi:hypothetical protein